MTKSNAQRPELEIELDTVRSEALQALNELQNLAQLEQWRVRYFGRHGRLKALRLQIAALPEADRPEIGKKLNMCETDLLTALTDSQDAFGKAAMVAQLNSEKLDISLPARPLPCGSLHPVTHTIAKINAYFSRLGFIVTEGPEIEDAYHNFDALNVPPVHPARAESDTFWFDANHLLRTHTSGVQIRTMLAQKPPIRILSPGRVYRRDSDQTHTPMFHQVEGLLVDEKITFSDLKGIMEDFIFDFFEDQVKAVRFRPSFFPFTEPSAEVDIKTQDDQWLEVLGCGMVHPNVFQAVGLDGRSMQGFAFGLGVERFAMLRYNVKDLRTFFENDIRFLKQLSV